jgi:membrane protein implicated in regulation of membrane protease activity
MAQSKTSSLVESILNQISGFLLSLFVWAYVVAPLYGFSPDWGTNFEITAIFAVVSTARSYLWRRFFNGREKCLKS